MPNQTQARTGRTNRNQGQAQRRRPGARKPTRTPRAHVEQTHLHAAKRRHPSWTERTVHMPNKATARPGMTVVEWAGLSVHLSDERTRCADNRARSLAGHAAATVTGWWVGRRAPRWMISSAAATLISQPAAIVMSRPGTVIGPTAISH